MLSLFDCITCSSSLSLEEIKLIAMVNWILCVLDFLRLLVMSFKHVIVLLKYSSADAVLFLSTLLSYLI